MTKEQAKEKFRKAVHEATAILEDLVREGRLSQDGNDNPSEEIEAIGDLRNEFAEGAAEFIERHWVSFDGPAKAPLTDDGASDLADDAKGDTPPADSGTSDDAKGDTSPAVDTTESGDDAA